MDAEGRLQWLRCKTFLRKMSAVIKSKPKSYSYTENTTRMFAMRSSKDLLWCFLQVGHCVHGPLGPSLLLGW